MKKRYFIIILLGLQHFVFAQEVFTDRLVDWSVAGLIEAISEPSNIVDVTDYGLVGDSAVNNSNYIQTAINALGGNPGVLFFPEGKYVFLSTVSIPEGIILRGEGSEKTKFYFGLGSNSSHCFSVSSGSVGRFVEVYDGFKKGSDTLILKSEVIFSSGDFAEMRQENGDWDTNPASWASYAVGQVLKVKNQHADTLFLENSLRLDYDTTLNLEVRKINPVQNVAFECFYIERVDEPVSAGSNFYFYNAANCRISGIESNVSSGAHIYITVSTNILIEGSYIHHAHKYDGSGTNGYGVLILHHSGECLVRNNIFNHLRHAMIIKQGANGNVIAYNYSTDPNRSEFLSAYTGDISLHGHYAYANLFEGNVVQNIILDHYWGPSGPYNTFLRNRVELYGIMFSDDGSVLSDKQNVIGNEVTGTGILYGKYDLGGSDHYEFGNNVGGTTKPASTSNVTLNSYLLEEQPGFWMNSLNWPPIGYPNTLGQYKIPAQLRYESGSGFTICPGLETAIDDYFMDEQITVSPNPFTNYLNIDVSIDFQGSFYLEIYDFNGRLIVRKEYGAAEKSIVLDQEIEHLSKGVYFLFNG